jgi:serine/threonine-protein kinase
MLGPAPIRHARLDPGSYVALVRPSSGREVRVPLVLREGDDARIVLDLSLAADIDEGEVFVAGGVALLGGDGDTIDGRELRRVDMAPFAIGENPVSFAAYLEFVADAYEIDPEQASQYLPCGHDMTPYWRWERGKFVPGRVKEWGADAATLLGLPAVGVDALSAEAYARWRSQRSNGRTYRLPSEDEWEKAARGVDGRRYPWGDAFDPGFCKMRESRPGRPRPEASGAFPDDVSPFGARDMAGGVADWTTRVGPAWGSEAPGSLRVVSRGGAWSDGSVDCRLSGGRPYFATEKSGRVGVRLARTITSQPVAAKLSSSVTALLRAPRNR